MLLRKNLRGEIMDVKTNVKIIRLISSYCPKDVVDEVLKILIDNQQEVEE